MSLQENDETNEILLCSTSTAHLSGSKNTNTTSTSTNRISPPLHLTINQFQPVFKETRKNKQQQNTKTNDKGRNLDQTLFTEQRDENTSVDVWTNEEYNEFRDENLPEVSSNHCHIATEFHELNKLQSITNINKKSESVVVNDDHVHNDALDKKYSNNDTANENKSKTRQDTFHPVAAQSSPNSNKIQCFVMSPSPTCNVNNVQEVFNLNQHVDKSSSLSANNSKVHKETVVALKETTDNNVIQGQTVCTTSVLNDDFTSDITNEFCPGYSPSRHPLIQSRNMEQGEDSGLTNMGRAILTSSSRVSTWTATKTRRLSLLGQTLIKSSFSSSTEQRSHGEAAGRNLGSKKVQFDKTEEVASNTNSEEKDPER